LVLGIEDRDQRVVDRHCGEHAVEDDCDRLRQQRTFTAVERTEFVTVNYRSARLPYLIASAEDGAIPESKRSKRP
jgi:hypothetical protein